VQAKLLDAAGLAALERGSWDALAHHAVVENPFYARPYVLAGLATIDRSVEMRAFAVFTASGDIVGLFPFIQAGSRASGAHNLYQFNGTPLVHEDYLVPVVSTWTNAIASDRLPRVWRLPDVRLDTALAEAIREAAVSDGLHTAMANTYRRPRLTRLAGGLQQHVKTVLSRNRRKAIKRDLRRLRTLGTIRFERAEDPALVRQRVEQFLSLEQAGWKGKAGTALLCHPSHASFARAAFAGAPDGPSRTSVDSLLLNDVPVALSLNVGLSDTLFTPKSAYDERLRQLGPGIVLEYLIIQHFYADDQFLAMDSATTRDGHVLQELWNESVPMGEIYVGTPLRTHVAVNTAKAYASARSLARRLIARASRRHRQRRVPLRDGDGKARPLHL
jgi:CelD/BcsL family acetyltransferase involved in cellulose biosynthesis